MLRILLIIAALTGAFPAFAANPIAGSGYSVTGMQTPSASLSTPVAAAVKPPGVTGAFTTLHTYYLSPTGSDSNAGTTDAPWATPKHALVCGDVIIARKGAYNGFNGFGPVANCPSTSGGIDGSGGVWFATLLCGGADLGDNGCSINCATAACNAGAAGTRACIDIAQSHWAVEGWACNGNAVARAFQVDSCATASTVIHHVAFINDVAVNTAQGYDINDCGKGVAPAFTNGGDYWAVVGVIAQNASQDPICLGAIDAVGPGQLDANPGTHIFFYGNFSYAHANPGCRSNYDTEGYMFDTWDAHGVSYQGVIANNIGFGADRSCIQLTQQNHASTAHIVIVGNTCFQNNVNNGSDWLGGEINFGSASPPMTYSASVLNNIAFQPLAVSGGGGGATAFVATQMTTTPVVAGNVFMANAACRAPKCDSTGSAQTWSRAEALGTGNVYKNPSFADTADLLTNRMGAPNCTGSATTTACMAQVIADLTPTASGMTGKGYQPPGPCTPDPLYPTWLKGVVYLSVGKGGGIAVQAGLVTKPCGL